MIIGSIGEQKGAILRVPRKSLRSKNLYRRTVFLAGDLGVGRGEGR